MYDIIFISRNNKSSELDFNRLKQTWPFAKTAESFRAAQKKSTTKLDLYRKSIKKLKHTKKG